MIHGKLNGGDKVGIGAVSSVVKHFDSHDLCTRCYARLGAGVALTCDDACHMCAMAVVIHGIIVVIADVESVMGVIRSAIPHAACNVDVGVIDTGVDDSHDDAIAIIAC